MGVEVSVGAEVGNQVDAIVLLEVEEAVYDVGMTSSVGQQISDSTFLQGVVHDAGGVGHTADIGSAGQRHGLNSDDAPFTDGEWGQ
ncbi:hypothetical protein PF008_g15873 [Phytophthora fragariae]|uniref:Uncharacterized protein n=1 Tax=Phytophthora fragariae TaxID=53985 RepID=A0A6G0RDP4_9STRA|nr:hypothetical protein PF008_g15873 [Phytophthora fragariae]